MGTKHLFERTWGTWNKSGYMPTEGNFELEGCAGRQTRRKTKLGELVSATKKADSSFSLLILSLNACIVDVAIMAFFPEDYLWCALFLYEMI